jgi:hypothetical protein
MTRVFLASDMDAQYKGRMQKEEGRNDLREGGILPAGKLAPLRLETDELTAIFVTIVKRSKA